MSIIPGIVDRFDDYSEIFVKISELLPESLWITELEYSKGNLNITGSTPDMAMVSELIEGIKSSGEFAGVIFKSSEKAGAGPDYISARRSSGN